MSFVSYAFEDVMHDVWYQYATTEVKVLQLKKNRPAVDTDEHSV